MGRYTTNQLFTWEHDVLNQFFGVPNLQTLRAYRQSCRWVSPSFFVTYSLNKAQNVRRYIMVNPFLIWPSWWWIYWDLLGFTGIYWDIMVNLRVNLTGKTSFLKTSFQNHPIAPFFRGAVLTSSHHNLDLWDLWDRELLNLCAAWLVTTVTVLLVSELLWSHLDCQKAARLGSATATAKKN